MVFIILHGTVNAQESWHVTGQYLLGVLTMPKTATPPWPVPSGSCPGVRTALPRGYCGSGFTSSGWAVFPWSGVYAKEVMVRNLSLTPEGTTDSAAKMTAAQRKPFHSVAKVVLDTRTVLDYLLAKQGSICAVADTTSCIWGKTSGEAETH